MFASLRVCGKDRERWQKVNNEGVAPCVCVCETFPGSPRDLGLNLGKSKPTEWNGLFHFSITRNVFTYRLIS